jgi:hypothetical protein
MTVKYTHEDVYANARFAGLVDRYHTWPVNRGQTNGEHTWQVMRIWYQIFGPLTTEESTAAIWHDGGELYTGDLPGMIKAEAPALKPVLDRLERQQVEDMGGPNRTFNPTERTLLRLKVCDLIDVLEFGRLECLQGNRLAEPIVKFALDKLGVIYGKLSRADFDKVLAYVQPIEEWYAR